MIKEKLKNCLLTVILSILFIASMFAIIGLSSCNVKKTILSNDINIENDNLSLKKDYHTDSNGNLVSDNLFGDYTFNAQANTSIISRDNSNVSFSVSGSSYSYIQYVFNNLSSNTYTLSFSSSGSFNIIVESSSNIVLNTVVSSSGYHSYTFSCSGLTYFNFGGVVGSITINNIMFNVGSTALAFEPYGSWVPSSLISNNLFYNAKLDYYFNLNVANPGISHVIGADLLQGDTYLSINQFLSLYFDSNTRQDYTENNNLSYWKLTFNKSFPLEQLILNFDTTQANTFDYYVTYYFEDGSTYIYHNASSSDFYRSFVVDLTQVNGLSGKLVNAISFRRQYSYHVNIISVGSYLIGFNDGLTQANTNHKEEIDSLNQIIKDKDIEIEDLEFTIRDLNERLNTNINNLFYTMISAVMSTPFNILHDYLNWNFFGINLFSLFTSLVTLLIILWVVKFLLGRK